jgi:hypothetical protein
MLQEAPGREECSFFIILVVSIDFGFDAEDLLPCVVVELVCRDDDPVQIKNDCLSFVHKCSPLDPKPTSRQLGRLGPEKAPTSRRTGRQGFAFETGLPTI